MTVYGNASWVTNSSCGSTAEQRSPVCSATNSYNFFCAWMDTVGSHRLCSSHLFFRFAYIWTHGELVFFQTTDDSTIGISRICGSKKSASYRRGDRCFVRETQKTRICHGQVCGQI